MTTPDTASFEVWRATDDGAECVATAPDKTAAHELMRKRGLKLPEPDKQPGYGH